MVRTILVFLLVLPLVGCSKKEDVDLIAYVKQLEPLQQYNEKIEKYARMLKDNPDSITTLEPIYKLFDEYKAAVSDSVEKPRSTVLKAVHGIYERSFDKAQRQLTKATRPDKYSLLKTGMAISILRKEVAERVYPKLQKMLEKYGLQDQYSLKWPSVEE